MRVYDRVEGVLCGVMSEYGQPFSDQLLGEEHLTRHGQLQPSYLFCLSPRDIGTEPNRTEPPVNYFGECPTSVKPKCDAQFHGNGAQTQRAWQLGYR
jgi:hypothetical protein